LSEGADPHLSRLRWRCRRGMKELDVVLTRYLEHDYPGAGAVERKAFEDLLELQDPDLYSYLIGRVPLPGDPETAHVLTKLARHRH
jgi:antitoxin CptB